MGCLKSCLIVISVIVGILGLLLHKITSPGPIAQFDKNQYWGPGKPPANPDTSVRSFQINIPQKELKDLRWRLNNARPLVPPLEGIQQQYGMNTNLLKEILEFWKTKYNWTERQEYFNQYPQFKTNIQGLDIHVLHVKPQNPGNKKVLPLLMIHGWPGSVKEFYDIIKILTKSSNDRDFVFEVIAPHIPGFGFSQAAAKPGLGSNQIAVIMANLMERLGYGKFYCQGGDFGSIILQSLSVIYPEKILGFHTNMPYVSTSWSYIKTFLGQVYPSWVVKPEHYNRVYPLWEKAHHRILENGYLHLQATKPDTLGVGLIDSPAGLAAYFLEKFTTGTNKAFQKRDDGGLLEKFTYTDLLDNVMLYWWTSSATTSMRLYAETLSKSHMDQSVLRTPLKVPTAIARFAYDFYVADGLLGEIYLNNLQLNDLEGGHFAALEVPDILAKDIFSAVQKFEEYNKNYTTN